MSVATYLAFGLLLMTRGYRLTARRCFAALDINCLAPYVSNLALIRSFLNGSRLGCFSPQPKGKLRRNHREDGSPLDKQKPRTMRPV